MSGLLRDLIGAYPQANIKDAEATMNVWMMSVSSYEYDDVLEAARLHIQRSRFFPTPYDIIELIPKAKIRNEIGASQPTLMIEGDTDDNPTIEDDEIWQIFGKGLGY